MAHGNYEAAKKKVYAGMMLLAVVTLVEVILSLFGKGHIIQGMEDNSVVVYVVGFLIIALSLYKAYFIVFEFMHMKDEAKSLAMTVLLPTLLLVWAVIAFFQEGDAWGNNREKVQIKNQVMEDNYYEKVPARHLQDVKVTQGERQSEAHGEHH